MTPVRAPADLTSHLTPEESEYCVMVRPLNTEIVFFLCHLFYVTTVICSLTAVGSLWQVQEIIEFVVLSFCSVSVLGSP